MGYIYKIKLETYLMLRLDMMASSIVDIFSFLRAQRKKISQKQKIYSTLQSTFLNFIDSPIRVKQQQQQKILIFWVGDMISPRFMCCKSAPRRLAFQWWLHRVFKWPRGTTKCLCFSLLILILRITSTFYNEIFFQPSCAVKL